MLMRFAAAAALIILFLALYFAIANSLPADAGMSLATPVDAWIPFTSSAVLIYAWVYTGALLPLFTVRSPALFKRVVLAYAVVIVVCSGCFLLFPVSAATLRPTLPQLRDPSFIDWSIRLLYALDPPINLFPSLHVAMATCAATASWMAHKHYGLFAFPWLAAVMASTCLTKQHYVLDVVSGFCLGALVLWLCTRKLSRCSESAASRGAVMFLGPLVLHISLLLVFYVTYSADVGARVGS